MTLLAPAALFGLALLALPILVHLFKPRRVRQTPFSSLRWLHLTQQRMARRIQWHQVMLFLLRVSMISLLVMALARPLLSPSGGSGNVDRIVCLDVSRSMGRRVEGRPTPLETARTLAAQLVSQALPGDRTALLLAGSKTAVLAPWTTDASLYLPALESLEPGATEANLDAALDLVRSLLVQRRTDAQVEICFLTDCPAGGWTAGAIAEFVRDLPSEPAVTLRLVDVALPAPRNGWLVSARLRETDGRAALRVEAASIGEVPGTRTLHAAGPSGGEMPSISVTLEPGRTTDVDLPLPATFRRADGQLKLWLEPPDELPDDDELFIDLDAAGALRILLVDSESPADPSLRPGWHLRTAIGALAETDGAAANAVLTVRSPADLLAGDIAAADVILLADVLGLKEAQADSLTERVRAGAGAAIFLEPGLEADVYNQRFTRPLSPGDGLLPGSLGSVVLATATPERLAPWGEWSARHPLLAGLVDPLLGDLTTIHSQAYFRFADPPSPRDEVLASFNDGTPALVARRVGSGRVVVLNASANDRWCDLPRRKSFVPLVDRLLSFLKASGLRRSFTAGETVLLALPADFDAAEVSVVTPSGDALELPVDRSSDRPLLRFDKATETGFYQVPAVTEKSPTAEGSSVSGGANGTPDPGLTFVVQPGRGDSPLRTLDPETLRSWWAPARFEIVKPSALTQTAQLADGRVVLEPWLIGLACLAFLAEMVLVHVLCPRITPAGSTSHVHRRGFVVPLRSRGGAMP